MESNINVIVKSELLERSYPWSDMPFSLGELKKTTEILLKLEKTILAKEFFFQEDWSHPATIHDRNDKRIAEELCALTGTVVLRTGDPYRTYIKIMYEDYVAKCRRNSVAEKEILDEEAYREKELSAVQPVLAEYNKDLEVIVVYVDNVAQYCASLDERGVSWKASYACALARVLCYALEARLFHNCLFTAEDNAVLRATAEYFAYRAVGNSSLWEAVDQYDSPLTYIMKNDWKDGLVYDFPGAGALYFFDKEKKTVTNIICCGLSNSLDAAFKKLFSDVDRTEDTTRVNRLPDDSFSAARGFGVTSLMTILPRETIDSFKGQPYIKVLYQLTPLIRVNYGSLTNFCTEANLTRDAWNHFIGRNGGCSRETLLAILITIGMDLPQIEEVLRQNRYALSDDSDDNLIKNCIKARIFDVHEINRRLYNEGHKTVLGTKLRD